jgi:hypothetical protein
MKASTQALMKGCRPAGMLAGRDASRPASLNESFNESFNYFQILPAGQDASRPGGRLASPI